MKNFIIILLLSCGLAGVSVAGKTAQTIDYTAFDVGATPVPVPWSNEASAICPYDDYDLRQAATYAYHYYNDLYWVAKSGYEEWGWDWTITRNWLQREMYDRWKLEGGGLDGD